MFILKKKVSGRYQLPWMTKYTRRLIRKKQRVYNRAKKSNKGRDWKYFRKLLTGTTSILLIVNNE